MQTLHVHGQQHWHDDVTIIGTPDALALLVWKLQSAISDHNLKSRQKTNNPGADTDVIGFATTADPADEMINESLFTSDGEGYSTHAVCLSEDDVRWGKLAMPYHDVSLFSIKHDDLVWRLKEFVEYGTFPQELPESTANQCFEDALDCIRKWPISDNYQPLFDHIVSNVWNHDFGKAIASDNEYGQIEYTFVTGGWSENEEILATLKEQTLVWSLTWLMSERGGRHVFRLLPKFKNCKTVLNPKKTT
jgi:hypothetical protein